MKLSHVTIDRFCQERGASGGYMVCAVLGGPPVPAG
jgi:hypothetical protein